MAMTLEELQVIITAKTAGLQSELSKVKGQMSGLQGSVDKSVGGIGAAFSGLKSALIALGIGKVIKDSIMAGMDAIESENLFDTVMGAWSKSVRAWSQELQDSLGLNGYALRKNVGMFTAMTTSMGFSKGQAVEMSKAMTMLAEDMASFYNISSEDAMTKLSAGLTGETEPLKRLGILVNESVIKQTAYKNGIAAVGAELTEQQKVMARYQTIMESTKVAQGDLARTIDSPANQLRLLQTQLQLLKINLGQAFMPIVQVVLPLLITLAKGLNWIVSIVASFMKALFGVSATQKSSAGGAKALENANLGAGSSMDKLGDKAGGAGKKLKKAGQDAKGALASFDEINSLDMSKGNSGEDDDPSGGEDIPPIDMGDTGLSEMDKEVDKLAESIKATFAGLGAWFSEMGKLFEPGWKVFMDMLKTDLKNTKTFFEPLKEAFKDIGDRWLQSVNYTIPLIADAFNTIMPVVSKANDRIWEVILANAEPFADDIRTIFISIFDFNDAILAPIIDTFTNMALIIIPIFAELKANTVQIFFDIVASIADVIKPALDFFSLLVSTVFTNISNFLSINNASIVDRFAQAFNDIYVRVSESIKGLSETLVRVFTYLKEWLIINSDEINKTLTNTWTTIASILKDTWDILSGVAFSIFDTLKEFFKKNMDDISSHLKTSWETLTGGIMDIWNSLLKTAKEIFSELAKWFDENSAEIEDVLTKTWETIWAVIEPIWKIINDTAKVIFDGIAKFFDNNSSGIAKFITEAWNLIWSIIKPIWDAMLENAKTIFGALSEFWDIWGEDISNAFKIIFEGISDVFGGVLKILTGLFEVFSGFFTGNWSKMWEGCRDIFGGIFDSLGGIIKFAMNAVINVINTSISAINSAMQIDIPDWVPGIGGHHYGVSIPKIPYLAEGGIIDKPTTAVIGEAGPEMVVPLKNTPFVDKIAGAIGSTVMAAMQFSGGSNSSQQSQGDTILQMDGTTFARLIKTYTDDEDNRMGNNLIIQTV
ncbi:phage tail protein [Clostridium gasigenes]|uniref:Phage-related protein n=1 Tax=Clostridium gasigenes TaxID=94869 RepID=A0A7X0VSE0_9CLOT|nr:hypothetical protein [Clostridium gasigenes]MBB6716372.1 hypothetical protein [Clostridium gasigenes]